MAYLKFENLYTINQYYPFLFDKSEMHMYGCF